MHKPEGQRRHTASQEGFSLLEMLLACAVLMVGILSVVQLVPATLRVNLRNRLDTMATVIAQRELDQMLSQPLSTASFIDRNSYDGSNYIITMAGDGSPGAPVVMAGSAAVIDFSVDAGSVPANFIIPAYPGPNGAIFELRWAVIPQTTGGVVIGRRIIVGCRQANANQPMLPVNLDSSVQR